MSTQAQFVVAVPFRSVCDDQARILAKHGLLRLYALWTRRGTTGIPSDVTRLCPALGMLAYVGGWVLPPFYAESFRFSLYPLYDQWILRQLKPGDHIISSYAYANACFSWARKHGSKTMLDGGNSHPDNFWEILVEEHKRWNCSTPPVARFYYERARRMMEDVDYVLSPSSYVRNSFLSRGFKTNQILDVWYAVDLSRYKPSSQPRPAARPLTIVNTASLSLRKGTPYLLEAFRLIRKEVADARLLLTEIVTESVKPILKRYRDLPVDWSPPLNKERLADRLRSADLFILPSLEEGLVRTALEAMAFGLPVVLTPNTGTSDFVSPGVNGSVVPIRDPRAIADAALGWWERLRQGYRVPVTDFQSQVSFERLERVFIEHLRKLGFLPGEPLPQHKTKSQDLSN
jgi:glycosyltransferase involved in cell wall biosynthesis